MLEAVTAGEIEKTRSSDFQTELLRFAFVEPQRSLIVGLEAENGRQQEQSRDDDRE
jgi:hypothetical protein